MKALLTRTFDNDKQTLGVLQIIDGSNIVYSCWSLELPNLDNKQNVSRIFAGTYKVVKRRSKKFGLHFHILDVPGRKWILIHKGNFHSDIRGCVLVGHNTRDINGDGYLDVAGSKIAMDHLLEILPDYFDIEIKNI